jgi:SNF2 family DNA or RNA helicase
LNKIPVKEVRGKFEAHNKIHKFLLEYNEYVGDKKASNNENINKMETKMYRLDVGKEREPRQYGDKDIPIFKNYRKLKDFQLDSLNWLIKSWYENKNTILAD